jgi:hypothetical protein
VLALGIFAAGEHRARMAAMAWVTALMSVATPTRAVIQVACSFDTTAAVVMVPAVVFLSDPEERSPNLGKSQMLRYAQSIAQHFQRPVRLEIPFRPIVLAKSFGLPPDSVWFKLGGPLLLPLSPEGRLEGRQVSALSSIEQVNDALTAAVARLDSSGGLPVGD